ncbi:MAG: hypothetical protein K2M64_01440 [Clostridia bacterium]|nr:hypothetical protein [Clostridia bacterium]
MSAEKNRIAIEETKKYFDGVINGIDCLESTEWETQTREVSVRIRDALISQYKDIVKDEWCEKRFIDYCNWVKSLLAVYNFGNLPAIDELEVQDASDKKTAANIKKGKEYIKEGIKNILLHIKKVGFDITPYLTQEDCLQIFGDENEQKITVPVTMSATTVFTTLVYFRRAYSRLGLFTDAELKLDPNDFPALIDESVTDLNDCVAQAVAQILYYFADFIVNGDQNRKFSGWGFTLSPQLTRAVTLNDTYAVVDAISRFDDAFNQDGTKRDKNFTDKVNAYGEAIGFKSLVNYCINAMYRTAFNTYNRDEDRLYGKSLFYVTNSKKNASIEYNYTPIAYEQIASSNRSSALFNPLYVAMITMYGYNEKEIVIRRFMDDNDLAKQYYEMYEPHLDTSTNKMTKLPEGVKKSISQYSKELEWFNGKSFANEVKLIINEHEGKTANHGMGDEWSNYYDIARVFQKYLETQLPGELMKITEYRDYLNSTKDAIDQIQVSYRKFDDSQRLGIVDTDYIMFSTLDFNTDSVTISKLNKANIPANYLRPLLLSSKIMIVNALTKYPQSDMEDLYEAIKASRHRKTISRGTKKNVLQNQNDDNTEWLWNEDTVDMNSTARHCETIMYDYFDYYERYELCYKALTNIKRSTNNILDSEKINKDGSLKLDKLFNEDGSLKFDELFTLNDEMGEFKHMVLDLTHQNVDKVQLVFNERLKECDKKLKAKEDEIAALKVAHEKDILKLKEEFKKEFNKSQTSITIGDTVRSWIRDESQRYFREMLSYMILNNLNGQQNDDEDFRLDNLMDYCTKEGGLVDGMFGDAGKLSRDIIDDYNKDAEHAEKAHGKKLREAIAMQYMFGGALDDLLRLDVIKNIVRGEKASLNEKNESVQNIYNQMKAYRREGKYNYANDEEKANTDTSKKEESN